MRQESNVRTPKYSEGTWCLYRKCGCIDAQVVQITHYEGGWSGSHCYVRVEPPVDEHDVVSDKYLTEIDTTNPLAIAAEFVGHLRHDPGLVNNPKRLVDATPTVVGNDLRIELGVPADFRSAWVVDINGQEVSRSDSAGPFNALRQLEEELRKKAGQETEGVLTQA